MTRRTIPGALLALACLTAPAAGQDVPINVSGELRLRPELERPAAFDTFDAFTLLRARLGLEAELAKSARIFLQVQDARTFGEEQNTTDATADRFDLHQGWLELVRPVGSASLAVRAGRQEISLGSERLVGAVGWSNTGRSFDALRVSLARPEATWNVTAFAATVRERGRRLVSTNSSDRSDHVLLGTYADTRVVDGFAFFDRADTVRAFTEIDRLTVGGRIDLPTTGPLSAWAEAAYQAGNQLLGTELGPQDQDIAAYFAGARVALAIESRLRSLGIGIDYLSGDETPADDEYGAFNTLYHTGHKWYGYMDLFLDPAARTGDRGLVDAIATATVALARDVPLTLDVHRFWTAAQRTDDEASDLGWELDFTVPLTIAAGQRLQLGYSAFRNGDAAPLAGIGESGDWGHWGYLMATFSFNHRATPGT